VVAATRACGRAHGLRITTGRKVIELRPDIDWDKGTTIAWLLDRIEGGDHTSGLGAVLPIYLGDDITDEDAFDAIQSDGVGIVVRHQEDGDRPSAAWFSLEDPPAVVDFARRLANDLHDAATAGGSPR
jgi:alpha,alpha-trehalase